MQANYIDVTDEWLKNARPNSHKVREMNYFEINGVKHYVDGKNIILDYSKEEKECALWLEKMFGGEIYLVPRVNYPDGISTPDFIWNNNYWDLKVVKSSGCRALDNRMRDTRNQSSNFIIDIMNNLLSDNKFIYQIKRLFDSNERYWVHQIILKRGERLIGVYKRKIRLTPSQT